MKYLSLFTSVTLFELYIERINDIQIQYFSFFYGLLEYKFKTRKLLKDLISSPKATSSYNLWRENPQKLPVLRL